MKSISFFVFMVLASAITCVTVWAQARAQISGTVRDQSGAVLPGVEVTATQTDTGISRSTITNETGSYILPNLAVGPYRFEAALPGFRTFVQTGIVLQVNSDAVINAVLEVGQVTETVEVQANVAQVETRSTAVGQVIENERILELPLNARTVTDLITLTGAAVQTGRGTNVQWQGVAKISIAGGQSFGVQYSLDGNMHNEPASGAQMPLPFPDALEEFRVDVSGTSASSGGKSGGVVNAVTKSGTNAFHGNLFEFVRNYQFNARNAFAQKRDSLKRNQYGGTLGGPIVRNKLFFFGGYQRTPTRSDPAGEILAFVPTAAMLAGDLTAFASPGCNAGRQITLRAPFVNNRIDPARYSKAALNLAARLPKPVDECGRTYYGYVQQLNEMQAVGKVDYQWTSNHSIFGRYLATTYSKPHPFNVSGNPLASTNDGGFDNLAQSYALGSTYLISPTTINAFRTTLNRMALHRLGPNLFGPKDLGINAYSSIEHDLELRVTGGGGFAVGNGSFNEARFATTSLGMSDDVNLARGSHQIAFGANVWTWRHKQRAHSASLGMYTFDGTATGLGMGDFLTGQLTQLSQGSTTLWATEQWYFGGYVADVWQVTRNLTLNYGVRWEPVLPPRLKDGNAYTFDYDKWRQGITSTLHPDAPPGVFFAGDPGAGPTGATINKQWLNLGPRVGLAWDVQGNGRTSLRSSYGLAYDTAGIVSLLGGGAVTAPWGGTTQNNSPVGGFEDPWRGFPGGNPFPRESRTSGVPTPFSGYTYPGSFDMETPTVHQWNLSIQGQVPADFLVSASYMGSRTSKLWQTRALNDPVFIPGVADANRRCFLNGQAVPYAVNAGTACSTTRNTNDRRPLRLQNPAAGLYFGGVGIREAQGTSNYHGLLLSVQRRAARGVNIGANHTWSHCIDDSTKPIAQVRFGDPDLNKPLAVDYGNCSSDRRHIFNMTAVADMPQFANPTLRALGTGWRVSAIYRKSTGSYLTLTSGLNRSLSGGTQAPNQVLENPYLDRNGINYLNPRAFDIPALGTFGNRGPRNIRGVGTWGFDMALSRTFRFAETQRLEFRAEAFNVTNSFRREFSVVREGNQATVVNSNVFGKIDASLDPRIMQFAFKYVF